MSPATFLVKIGIVDCKEPGCPNCPGFFYMIVLEDGTQIEVSAAYKDRLECEKAAAVAAKKVMRAYEKFIEKEQADSQPAQPEYLH